jgi:hypothetical protein
MKKNPYLQPGRLSHVIAAIEVLSVRPWAGIGVDKWVREVETPEGSFLSPETAEEATHKWTTVFREHPEFFKLYELKKDATTEHKVTLRLRSAYSINYDPKTGQEVPTEKLPKPPKLYDDYTRRPLTSSEIKILIKTAIDLHTRAIAERREARFYVPAALAVITAAFGELWRVFGSKLLHLLRLD